MGRVGDGEAGKVRERGVERVPDRVPVTSAMAGPERGDVIRMIDDRQRGHGPLPDAGATRRAGWFRAPLMPLLGAR